MDDELTDSLVIAIVVFVMAALMPLAVFFEVVY